MIWLIARCRECGDMDMPFTDTNERIRWAVAHTNATGHHIELIEVVKR